MSTFLSDNHPQGFTYPKYFNLVVLDRRITYNFHPCRPIIIYDTSISYTKGGYRKIVAQCQVGRGIFLSQYEWTVKTFTLKSRLNPVTPAIYHGWSLTILIWEVFPRNLSVWMKIWANKNTCTTKGVFITIVNTQ